MPTLIDSAKEATYAAIGLNVLFLDEIAERTADSRKQLETQLDIARTHGRKAQADMQKASNEFTTNLKERMPFDVDAAAERLKDAAPFDLEEMNETVQTRSQEFAMKGMELAEPAVKFITEMTPAPFDAMVTETVEKARSLLVADKPVVEVKKTVARKPAAKKTTARKPAAKKTVARKPAAKKTTARKPAAKKAAPTKPAARK